MQSESSKLSPEFIDVSVFVLRLYCNLILLLHICVRRTAFSAFCLLILFLLCCSIFLFLCSSFLSLLRALTSSVSSFFFLSLFVSIFLHCNPFLSSSVARSLGILFHVFTFFLFLFPFFSRLFLLLHYIYYYLLLSST